VPQGFEEGEVAPEDDEADKDERSEEPDAAKATMPSTKYAAAIMSWSSRMATKRLPRPATL